MKRSFQLLEQISDVVVRESWRKSQWAGFHDEPLPGSRLLGNIESDAKKSIHHFFKRHSRFTGLLSQFGADVVIQGKSGSHITKLALRHHDVNVRMLH